MACLVKARITKIVSVRHPFDLGDYALSVSHLDSPELLLISKLAERAISIVGEVVREAGELVVSRLFYNVLVGNDH